MKKFRLSYGFLITLFFFMAACGSSVKEEEKETENKVEEKVAENTAAPLTKDNLFADSDVLRWAIDRAYRKLVFEEGKPFAVSDKINKKSYNVEMAGMPKEEFYPVGTETAFVGVEMVTVPNKDSLLVDFKLAWNPTLYDPKYKRDGTFEILNYQIRRIDGQTRYRWIRDGDYWKQELITSSASK